jgi:hypothetical protein
MYINRTTYRIDKLMQHKLITQMTLALLLGRVGAQCTGVLKLHGWGHMELPDFQIEKVEH